MTANHLREHLKAAIDKVIDHHEVLRVTQQNGGDFVVLSAEDWDAITVPLHLDWVPGLVNSIKEAAKEPIEQGTDLGDLEW